MKPLILATLVLLVSCTTAPPRENPTDPGRLTARPHATATACAAGEERLKLSSGRGAILYIPKSATERAAPLLVFLHGAGGTAERMIEHIRPDAERYGMIVLVPGSVGQTWDGIRGTPGVDVARLDEALGAVFDRCPVDRRRLAVGGFSDGASYALTLGVANGDLFSHVLAFSPCGISREVRPVGKSAILISHGRDDSVLPIDRCGRPIASSLRRIGYNVRLVGFDGKHEIPETVAADAFAWFVGREAADGKTR